MLGRFVIPAARLADLAAYDEELFGSDPPFPFTVLGRGGETIAEFLAGLRADLGEIVAFRKRHGDRVAVDVFEVRLSADLCDPLADDSTENLFKTVCVFPAVGLVPFCEASGRPDGLLEQLAMLPGERVGFKLRCGGLDASAFPSSERIAAALRACLDAGVPFKATAGLHHPLPRFDASLKVRMHGFINLFLAGVLARARDWNAEQIRSILDDDDPKHFTFDDEGAAWRDLWVSTEEIAIGRESVLSFGSCSFDEPREELRALGWL